MLVCGASADGCPDEIEIAAGGVPTTVLGHRSLQVVPRFGEHGFGPLVEFTHEESRFRRLCRSVGIPVGPSVVAYRLTGEIVRGDVSGAYVFRAVRSDLWHEPMSAEHRLADRFEALGAQSEIRTSEVADALARLQVERFQRIREAWRALGRRSPDRRSGALVDAIVSAVTEGTADAADRRDIEALTDEFPEFVRVRLWSDPGNRFAVIESCLRSAHPLPRQVLELIAETGVQSDDVKRAVCLRLMTGPRADFVGLARVLGGDPEAIESALDVRRHRARDDEERAWVERVRTELAGVPAGDGR